LINPTYTCGQSVTNLISDLSSQGPLRFILYTYNCLKISKSYRCGSQAYMVFRFSHRPDALSLSLSLLIEKHDWFRQCPIWNFPALDILLDIDSNGRLTTSLYDKRRDFDFAIVNFSFLCSNIPLSPAYRVYTCISQLIRYARACFAYEDFSKRGKLLTKSWWCKVIMNLVWSHNFAYSTVAIRTLFAIIKYHWPCWIICFFLFVRLSFLYWLWRRVIPYT
jgi:hypothetical protein